MKKKKEEDPITTAKEAVKSKVERTGRRNDSIKCPGCPRKLMYHVKNTGQSRASCECGLNWSE